jgi:hypothetical protein
MTRSMFSVLVTEVDSNNYRVTLFRDNGQMFSVAAKVKDDLEYEIDGFLSDDENKLVIYAIETTRSK